MGGSGAREKGHIQFQSLPGFTERSITPPGEPHLSFRMGRLEKHRMLAGESVQGCYLTPTKWLSTLDFTNEDTSQQ